MIINKEIKRENSIEEKTNIKHEYTLTAMVDMHLSLWTLTFCIKYNKCKIRRSLSAWIHNQSRTPHETCVAE